MDFTRGTAWKQILWFGFPLLIASLIQQMYNSVDLFFVGNYLGTDEMAVSWKLRCCSKISGCGQPRKIVPLCQQFHNAEFDRGNPVITAGDMRGSAVSSAYTHSGRNIFSGKNLCDDIFFEFSHALML